MDLALLEAQYGFVTPKKVLEALQRDAFQAKSAPWQEDIYEKPMHEVGTTATAGTLKAEAHLPARRLGLASVCDMHTLSVHNFIS